MVGVGVGCFWGVCGRVLRGDFGVFCGLRVGVVLGDNNICEKMRKAIFRGEYLLKFIERFCVFCTKTPEKVWSFRR
jgi:hypothetical protein